MATWKLHSPTQSIDGFEVTAKDVKSGGPNGEWLDFFDDLGVLVLRVSAAQVVMAEKVGEVT